MYKFFSLAQKWCAASKKFELFWKIEKKIFFLVFCKKNWNFFFWKKNIFGHLPRKTTYGRRPGKKFHFPALPWCLCYLNITFTFTPLSSNCSIYHCCNPWITNNINNIMWQSYLLSCAFGQLKMYILFSSTTKQNLKLLTLKMSESWLF